MAEQTNEIEQQVEDMILAGFAKPPGDKQGRNAQDETGEKRVIDVDLYRLDGGAVLLVPGNAVTPLDANAIESMPPTHQEQGRATPETPPQPLVENHLQAQAAQRQETEPTKPTSRKRKVKPSFVLVPLLFLCVFATGAVSYLSLFPLTATATITITPKARSLHVNATFPIAVNPKAGQVQGRPLEAISFTKSETVPATGHAHDDPTRATGVVTFYNTDSSSYTIPAGVTFTTPSGQTVVTDNVVTVQAAILPDVGIAIASAHVIQAGSAGNIAAHTIYTRCCGSPFITATNTTPFSGGQDTRSYSFIQSSDIQNAANDLVGSLTPKATAALNKETHGGEQLVTPLCSPRTQESVEPGSEGTNVTVSITQTCASVAYTLSSLQEVATSTLAHLATPNYQEAGTVEVSVNGSTYAHHTATLQVALSGVWVYRFTKAELSRLTDHIAGESQEQAKATLERVDGVVSVSIHVQRLDFKDLLPTNPQHISVKFFYLVS